MNDMPVDVQKGGAIRAGIHQMSVPQFVVEGFA